MAAVSTRVLGSAPAVATGKAAFVQGQALSVASGTVTPSRGPRLVVRAASDKPVKANRQTWFSSPQSLSYLDGSLPGDFGFDPLGLSDPEGAGQFVDPKWLTYGEIINGRFAMLGAAGMIAPELLGKAGLIPESTGVVWFKSGVIPPLGTYDYWADPYALFALEIILIGFAEHRRAQDYYKPGYGSKTPLLGLEKFLAGSGEAAYPGGPFFNILNFGKGAASVKELRTKELKNGRLAMLAVLGFFIQGIVTGEGPVQNLFDHLSNPTAANILTNLKIH